MRLYKSAVCRWSDSCKTKEESDRVCVSEREVVKDSFMMKYVPDDHTQWLDLPSGPPEEGAVGEGDVSAGSMAARSHRLQKRRRSICVGAMAGRSLSCGLVIPNELSGGRKLRWNLLRV